MCKWQQAILIDIASSSYLFFFNSSSFFVVALKASYLLSNPIIFLLLSSSVYQVCVGNKLCQKQPDNKSNSTLGRQLKKIKNETTIS
jgi:hypothetical protein